MAVYKPTYCYPYLNTLDIRTVAIIENGLITPQAQFLSCKVDTSNSTITGYTVRLLDEYNKQIFPASTEYISPVTELQIAALGYEENGTNSGLNGTQLKIPFFQNYNDKLTTSRNAIYYKPRYLVDHLIMDGAIASLFEYTPITDPEEQSPEQVQDWYMSTIDGEDCLRYNWPASAEVRNILILDGETLVSGEIVLVAVGTQTTPDTEYQPFSGLWKVDQKNIDEQDEIVLTKITNYSHVSGSCRLNTGEMAALAKGNVLHNCVLKYTANSTPNSGYFETVGSAGLWCDKDGVTITNLQVDGRSLKWEVILYQGNYDTYTDIPGAIFYDSIQEEFLDIKLNSGTILGSTPTRIQIASADPAQYSGEIYLPSSTSGTIVLQDKHVALGFINPYATGDDRQRVFQDNRIYVRSYDASYGHIYPRDGDLDANTLGNATHCQFFEHSNDPDMILDSDIVTWGVNNYLRLYVGGSSFTNAYIALDDRNSYTWPYNFNDGDLVLLTGQGDPTPDDYAAGYGSLPYENGVYVYYELSAGKTINEDTPDEHTFHSFFKRAPSYLSWAPYIGKIIYCTQGDWVNMNVESLASAGTYTLWNPMAEVSGSSSLLFSQERPIQLFPQLLESNRTFKLYCDLNRPTDSGSGAYITVEGTIPMIDSQTVTVGDLVLFKDGQSATVLGYETSGSTTQISFDLDNGATQVKNGQYVYIISGQQCGKQVYLWDDTRNGIDGTKPNWDLYTGVILKNSPELTYVSPYANMEVGMMLKMLNSKMITFDGSSIGVARPATYQSIGSAVGVTVTPWIKILSYNNTLNYVTHARINCTSDGLDTQLGLLRSDGSYGLASYGMTDDIPWKYEVRSFFTKSNENGFYVFEEPYIRLQRDGFNYTNLRVAVDYEFDVLQAIQSTLYEDLYVQPESTGDDEEFRFIYYVDQATVSSRSIYLSAEYRQFNQISWESYRWVLFDEDGSVLQDTGNKYEGIIDVSFYGLSNTTNHDRIYYIALLVTDGMSNTLCCVIKLTSVADEDLEPLGTPSAFSAVFDPQTHAVLLDFTDEDETEAISYSFYRREYDIYQKPGTRFNGYLFDGVFYEDATKTIVLPTIPGCIYIDKRVEPNYSYACTYNVSLHQYEYNLTPVYQEYIGEWEPVLLKTSETSFRDYNITGGHSYQYVVFLNTEDEDEQKQMFANYTGKIFVPDADQEGHPGQGVIVSGGTRENSAITGEPVKVCWNEWSIVELQNQSNIVDAPILKKTYKANLDQLWLFKFSLETGNQTQNISRSEIQTLGQYPKIGFGRLNYLSGEVSALLGSEIIPYSQTRYIERLGASRVAPLSTNEKIAMLKQWRKLVSSKNPKLLRDIKGQSWIVQIFSGSNKPQNFYKNQPDTISFQWKQIGDLNNVVVYGEGGYKEFEENEGSVVWDSIFNN